MKLYHMSQTLQIGNILTPDYEKHQELIQPFIQALEQNVDCFYGMLLNGKYLYAVMNRFGLREWSNYAKWATEGIFEFIRKTEIGRASCRERVSAIV